MLHAGRFACVVLYRIHVLFSIFKARRISWTVWERSQPVQEHVCTRSTASDAGRHRLHYTTRSASSTTGDAVSRRHQGLQGLLITRNCTSGGLMVTCLTAVRQIRGSNPTISSCVFIANAWARAVHLTIHWLIQPSAFGGTVKWPPAFELSKYQVTSTIRLRYQLRESYDKKLIR